MRAIPFLLLLAAVPAVAADPWADRVVSYTPGEGVPAVFGSDPTLFFERSLSSLGEPSRTSGGFVVSPYSGAFTPEDVVSIGEGGSLTVAFDEPVTDDPLNPFGIDLLLFGNAFFTFEPGTPFPFPDDSVVAGSASEPGVIEISPDGVVWTLVTGLDPDGIYPTNGFADSTGFFPRSPGGVLSDFTLPVDPIYDPIGDTSEEVYAAYGRSGGGAGVDIGAFGLSEISFVRVSNPDGSGFTPEIDAFADVRAVPEPTMLAGVLLTMILASTGRIR